MNEFKDFTEPIPIMLIAYNRPAALIRQLKSLDNLSPRRVVIYVDGPTDKTLKEQRDVLRIAENWGETCGHFVTIRAQKSNLGIYNHFPKVAEDFFTVNTLGVVLEDDIYFTQGFLQHCEAARHLLQMGELWSVCGHNPLTEKFINTENLFRTLQSHIHTIWGWASSSTSIDSYLQYITKSEREMHKDIEQFAKFITNDPLLRRGIESTWKRKLARSISKNVGGSWDTLWELAGWESKKPSLLPSTSLSVEVSVAGERGTHQSERVPQLITDSALFALDSRMLGHSKRLDLQIMRMWGITRKYSWAYAFRISSQLNESKLI